MRRIIILITIILLNGCANYHPDNNNYSDPMSGFNRTMFKFNYNVLDPYFLRPVAVVWKNYVLSPIREGISGVSSNLGEPISMVNSIFQLDAHQFGIHLSRFMLNTFLGFGGLIDVASRADPQLHKGNKITFGTTLGYYNMPYGPYVVVPFYGQATLREDGGNIVDSLYSPLTYISPEAVFVRWVFNGIEERATAIEYENVLNSSSDPYEFLRNAYFQRHDFLSSEGKIDAKKQQQREASLADQIDDIDAE